LPRRGTPSPVGAAPCDSKRRCVTKLRWLPLRQRGRRPRARAGRGSLRGAMPPLPALRYAGCRCCSRGAGRRLRREIWRGMAAPSFLVMVWSRSCAILHEERSDAQNLRQMLSKWFCPPVHQLSAEKAGHALDTGIMISLYSYTFREGGPPLWVPPWFTVQQFPSPPHCKGQQEASAWL
jgi:hypothetical protein